MATFQLKMPKLGESIIEATITKWLKSEGEAVAEDDPLVEIATDKVDSEIPSPVEGRLVKQLYKEGDVVPVGETIALLEMEGDKEEPETQPAVPESFKGNVPEPVTTETPFKDEFGATERFYSPLVRNIARQEDIPVAELDTIPGSGKDNRLTKSDLLHYIEIRSTVTMPPKPEKKDETRTSMPAVSMSKEDEVIEMDRMRKLIAEHMVMSVQTSPHVTSLVEVDVTPIVKWREKNKDHIQKRYSEKLTFTHVFIDALARAVKEFPMINASVDGSRIIVKKNVNIGMAVALPSGNLIVPVIKNVDQKNLLGVVKEVNSLAEKARNNKLQPDDIQGGTITLTNLGSFGTLLGTPIINQPQVAIIAVGSIQKRPVVVEGPDGDMIAIRHMMYLSVSYDHRIIDGALGGRFIHRMKELLEHFDIQTSL